MRARIAVPLACALALGCGEPTGPSALEVLFETLHDFQGAEAHFGTGLGHGGAPELGQLGSALANPCHLVETESRFACQDSFGGTRSYTYELFDAANQRLTFFDPETVASIRVITTASGTVTTQGTVFQPATSTTFASAGDYTYSGLLAGAQRIDGNGSTTATLTVNGKSTTTTTVRSVTGLKPAITPVEKAASAGLGFPTQGRITSAVTGTDTLGAPLPVTSVETTFNGTPTVVTTVLRNGTTETWTCTYSKTVYTNSETVWVTCSTS